MKNDDEGVNEGFDEGGDEGSNDNGADVKQLIFCFLRGFDYRQTE